MEQQSKSAPNPMPRIIRALRLLLVNIVVGITAGPVLLTVVQTVVLCLFGAAGYGMSNLLRNAKLTLVDFGPLWGHLSVLFCMVFWLPLWLTQSFHPIFRKGAIAAFTGCILGGIFYSLTWGDFVERNEATLAGVISGICIFLLSHLYRERAELPANPLNEPVGRTHHHPAIPPSSNSRSSRSESCE